MNMRVYISFVMKFLKLNYSQSYTQIIQEILHFAQFCIKRIISIALNRDLKFTDYELLGINYWLGVAGIFEIS